MSTRDIFKEYMLDTVEKLKELKISLKKGAKYQTKKDLADALNLHSSEFYAICYQDDELD